MLGSLVADRLGADAAGARAAASAIANAQAELGSCIARVESRITGAAAHACCDVLRAGTGVRQVLSTYRMTDRPAPTEASAYVAAAIAPLRSLVDESGRLATGTAERWVCAATEVVCREYGALCREVVESARKTAAGLGLIKTRRKKTAGAPPTESVSDTDKICAQLRLDVEALGALLPTELQVRPEALRDLAAYVQLRNQVSEL